MNVVHMNAVHMNVVHMNPAHMNPRYRKLGKDFIFPEQAISRLGQ